jgi:hypothetical protein
MTNLLVDKLPEAVEIDGKEYEIHTDYRAALRVILAFEDDELTNQEKQIVMLRSLYPVMPDNIEQALKLAGKFLNGGEAIEDEEHRARLYSFSKDAGLIFAAFRQTHGIDLETAQMHWWKFLTLFMDLGQETAFCGLVSFRKRIKSGKATKEEKAAYREMRDLVDLPEVDTRTLEEKERAAEFFRLAEEGRRRREVQKAAASQG